MQSYSNNVQDSFGNVVPGTTVLVKTAAGATATIYSDNGVTAQANPITPNASTGQFSFFAANGSYTATVTGGVAPVVIPIVLFDGVEIEAEWDDKIATATAQAGIATAKAGEASDSASAAAGSASAASGDKDQTALDRIATAADRVQTGLDRTASAGSAATAAYIYPGSFTSAPTTRPDASAIQSGDVYFNSATLLSYRWNGSTWNASDINTANLAASGGSGLVGHLDGTVGSRLSTADALRGSQQTSLVDRVRASSYVKALYYRTSAAATDRFIVGYNINGENGVEFQLLRDFDNMLIVRGMTANSLEPGTATRAQNFVGTFNYSSQPNSYTTQLGAKFDLPFTGTGLLFKTYTDNRGGVWRFTIDGGTPIDFSTFTTVAADPAAVPTFPIVTGLADTAHACTVEFMGADPSNPPSGGTARGWLFYSNTVTTYYTGYGTTSGARLMNLTGATSVMAGSSIPDFAISATKNGSGITGDWVPAHSNPGACRNITTNVLVDGVDVGTTFASYPALAACECVVIKHTYDAYSSFDSVGANKLWTGVLVKKFDKTGLTISHNIKLTNDVYCGAGYFASMVPVMASTVNRVVYCNGYKKTVTTPGVETNTNVTGAPSSMAFYGTANNKGVACEVQSASDALGLFSKPLEAAAVMINERTDGVTKHYWRRWYQEVIASGSEHTILTTIFPIVNVDVTQF